MARCDMNMHLRISLIVICWTQVGFVGLGERLVNANWRAVFLVQADGQGGENSVIEPSAVTGD